MGCAAPVADPGATLGAVRDTDIGGALVVDKPEGMTSHDVVNRVRRLVRHRRVGHLGTLDPLATGVLPVLVGRSTRLAAFYTDSDKVYDVTVRFGFATDTYDREGTPVSPEIPVTVSAEGLEPLLDEFRGPISMVPPARSAKKIQGRPAYELARQNIAVELKPVAVTIHELTLRRAEGAEADLLVHCSAGTYVRTLAHDLGQRLGSGAHVSRLRRLRSGDFDIEQAYSLERLATMEQDETLAQALLPATTLLPRFPATPVDGTTAGFIRQGREFRTSPFGGGGGAPFIKALSPDGSLLAIGKAKLPHVYHPVCVL